jgi:PTS system nitrogen regulatory IIA component
MMKLSEAIEFDAADGEPVDLIFGLMVPAEVRELDHANISGIADLLGDRELRTRLRTATSSNELYETLCAS